MDINSDIINRTAPHFDYTLPSDIPSGQCSGLSDILSDPVRCAPVLSVLLGGQYDCFGTVGKSVRIRDKKSGYFRFVINDENDIELLTEDILGTKHPIIAVDAQYEEKWRELFPNARIKQFRLTAVTGDMLYPSGGRTIPDDCNIVNMDESWDDLVIELCSDDEFTADILKRQLRENLSIGLLCNDERVGFISTHLNYELGPLWISHNHRGRNLGTILMREYLFEYFKDNSIIFGLSTPENLGSARIMEKLGFKTLDRHALMIN